MKKIIKEAILLICINIIIITFLQLSIFCCPAMGNGMTHIPESIKVEEFSKKAIGDIFPPYPISLISKTVVGDIDNDNKDELLISWHVEKGTLIEIFSITDRLEKKGSVLLTDEFLHIEEIGDCNNDGKNDVILTGQSITKIFKIDMATKNLKKIYEESSPNYFYPTVCVSDVNGDGEKEIIKTEFYRKTRENIYTKVSVNKWNNGKLQRIWRSDFARNIKKMICGDIDGDGKDEILIEHGGEIYGGNVLILDYKDGQFVKYDQDLNGDVIYQFISMVVGDFDNDGKDELVTYGESKDSGYWYERLVSFDIFNWENVKFKNTYHRNSKIIKEKDIWGEEKITFMKLGDTDSAWIIIEGKYEERRIFHHFVVSRIESKLEGD